MKKISNMELNDIRKIRIGIVTKFVLFVTLILVVAFSMTFYFVLSQQKHQITENLKEKSLAILQTLSVPVKDLLQNFASFKAHEEQIVKSKKYSPGLSQKFNDAKTKYRESENQLRKFHTQLMEDMNTKDFYIKSTFGKVFTFDKYGKKDAEDIPDTNQEKDFRLKFNRAINIHLRRLNPGIYYMPFFSSKKVKEYDRMRTSLPLFATIQTKNFYQDIYELFVKKHKPTQQAIVRRLLKQKKWQRHFDLDPNNKNFVQRTEQIVNKVQFSEIQNKLKDRYRIDLVYRALKNKVNQYITKEINKDDKWEEKIKDIDYEFYYFYKDAKYGQDLSDRKKEWQWFLKELVDITASKLIDNREWYKEYRIKYQLYRKSKQGKETKPQSPAEIKKQWLQALLAHTKYQNKISWKYTKELIVSQINSQKIPKNTTYYTQKDSWNFFELIREYISQRKYGFISTKLNLVKFATAVKAKEQLGVMVLVIEADDYKKRIAATSNSLIDIAISIILRILFLSILLAGLFTRGIKILGQGAKVIGDGNFDYKIQIKSSDEIGQLADTINQMSANLKIAQLEKEKQLMLESELRQASEIQQTLLPQAVDISGLEHDEYYKAESLSGGDYYDYFMINEDKIGWVIGDVSGHGVGAALVMAMTRSLVREYTKKWLDPQKALIDVNEVLCSDTQPQYFVTLFLAIFDKKTKKMQWSSAGHNPVYLLAPGQKAEELAAGGMALGSFSGERFAKKSLHNERTFHPNEIFLQYSDGITEAMNRKEEEYGDDRLQALVNNLTKAKNLTPQKIVQAIIRDVNAFTQGYRQNDDITVTCIRYNATS